MKKLGLTGMLLVLATGATAADLPGRRAAPSPIFTPAPVFSWTGLYAGVQVGYAGSRFNQTEYNAGFPTGFQASWRGSGIVGGGHLGYNWQMSSVVLGLEGDIEGSSVRGTVLSPSAAAGGFDSSAIRSGIRGSLRGRIGFAIDRFMVYATGGLAVANFRNSVGSPFVTETVNTTRPGYTVGGGVAYAFGQWSLRAEYRYSDFGNLNQTSVVAFPGFNYRTRVNDHSGRIGLSYHFSSPQPGAVVARY